MDIGSINTNLLNTVTDNASNSKIENTLKKGVNKSNDDELMEVCKEFEAYFYEQIFKNMKKSMVPAEESTDAATKTLVDFYEDKLTGEYAKSASDQQTNGLAQMLYEQMKRNID